MLRIPKYTLMCSFSLSLPRPRPLPPSLPALSLTSEFQKSLLNIFSWVFKGTSILQKSKPSIHTQLKATTATPNLVLSPMLYGISFKPLFQTKNSRCVSKPSSPLLPEHFSDRPLLFRPTAVAWFRVFFSSPEEIPNWPPYVHFNPVCHHLSTLLPLWSF